MAAPAKEETEAGFPPLLTYSVFGEKNVSLRDENNLTMGSAGVPKVLILCARHCLAVLSM